MKQRKRQLFRLTEQVDRKIQQNLQKEAIVLVGQTRRGKSTILNWMSNTHLTAVTVNEKICYKVFVDSLADNPIGHGYESCTLVPNIYRGESISYVDTAGFGDSVNYVRALLVSYVLQAIFDRAQKVKFILVVEESELTDGNGRNLFDSLNYFLNMFDLQKLEERQRKEIYLSVTLLVNFHKQGVNYSKLINSARDELKNPKLKKIQNRKFLVQMLTNILDESRFCCFNEAKIGYDAEPFSMMKKFEQSKSIWQYLTMNKETRSKYILLPISEDFKELQQEQQGQFIASMNMRIDSYKILNKYIYQLINKQLVNSETTNVGNVKLPYKDFYQFLEGFLQEHDDYNSEKLIGLNATKGKVYSKLSRDKLLLEIIQTKSCFESVGEDILQIDSQNAVQYFNSVYQALRNFCGHLVALFARDKSEHRMLLRLEFILLRGIRQFLMLRKVSYKAQNQKLKGIENIAFYTIRSVFQSQNNVSQNIIDFIDLFKDNLKDRVKLLSKSKSNPVQSYIRSRDSAYNIEYILETHKQLLYEYAKNKEQEKNILHQTINRILRDIKIIHARYQYQMGNYYNAVLYLIEAYRIELIYERYRKDLMVEKMFKEEIDLIQKRQMILNQENILAGIYFLLVKTKQLNLALELARHMNSHDDTCNIHELLLEKDKSEQSFNKQRILEYAKFCFEINRFERGVILYQKVIAAENQDLDKKKMVMKELANHISKRDQYALQYKEYLSYFQLSTIESRRRLIMSKIQMSVSKEYFFKKLGKLLKKAYFSTNINLQDSMLDSFQAMNVAERIIQQEYSKMRHKNKQLGIQVQMSGLLERTSNILKIQQYLIQIDNERDLFNLNKIFTNFYSKIIGKSNIVLFIDVRRMKVYHYSITEKYLKIRFEEKPIKSVSYLIRLYKFIKKIIFQDIQDCMQQAQKTFKLFHKEASNKLIQLYRNYEDNIESAEVIELLQLKYENDRGVLDKSIIKKSHSLIDTEIVEKIVNQWEIFMEGFLKNRQNEVNSLRQYEEYSDNLYYSDF